MMKKILIWTAAFFMGGVAYLQAQNANCVIMESSKTEKKVVAITPLPNGDLQFSDGKFQTVMKKGKYIWAWIPKPKEIQSADSAFAAKKYAEAATSFRALGKKYKNVGWDVYCIYKEAESLIEDKKVKEAIAVLEQLNNYKVVNPRVEGALMQANKLLVDSYIATKQDAKSLPVLNKLLLSPNDEIAAFGYLKKGDLLSSKGEKMDATLCYMQASILFPKSKLRPEALYKAAQTMRDQKDARAQNFEETLKKDYPSDPFTKQLK